MSKQKQKEKAKLLKKQKQEETKLILQQMKDTQISQEVLNSFDSIQKLSCKQKKKIKVQQENIINQDQEALPVNIFQQNFSQSIINNEPLQQKVQKFDIEIEAKKIIPDLTFNTYDQKLFKKWLAQENLPPQELSESSEEEDISDPNLRLILACQTKIVRNQIQRSSEQIKSREQLPIYMRESEIVDMVNNNLVSIITGQTGCGKSTQVPQFLYEAGYTNKEGYNPGMIGITQPRRIAAITLAKRLSDEMNVKLGEQVDIKFQIAYQVRHDTSQFGKQTCIKFQTDGILMNEMMSDFLLTKYSVIIIDEAHERKINSDLLLGILSRIVKIRAKLAIKNTGKIFPLRLIIMSATLQIEELQQNKHLFTQKVPQIDIETRQFPVQIFYEKRTEENYLEMSIKKAVKIHQRLPPGNILVFLTGELEIKQFCFELNIRLQNVADSDESELEYEDPITEKPQNQEFKIYPLYSKLTSEQQQDIFKSYQNTRVIVASTNVAETSLTIPGIKYVIDCGKQKRKIFSKNLQIMRFDIDWISQASANQRSGRAGRIGPGVCYRLYSTSVYSNQLIPHTEPEIISSPLEPTILSLYSIGLKDPLKFPFPTAPDQDLLKSAIKNLQNLQLVKDNALTELGKHVSVLPIAPKFGKMLLLSRAFSGLGYALLLVSVLSVEELVKTENKRRISLQECESEPDSDDDGFKNEIKNKKRQSRLRDTQMSDKKQQINDFKELYKDCIQNNSDIFLKMNLLGKFMQALYSTKVSYQSLDKLIVNFAKDYNLLAKSLKEIYSNMQQLTKILELLLISKTEFIAQEFFVSYTAPPKKMQENLIACLTNIFIDNIAKKTTFYRNETPYTAYTTPNINTTLFIPALSPLYHQQPAFIVFTHLTQNPYNNRYYIQNGSGIENAKILYDNDYNKQDIKYMGKVCYKDNKVMDWVKGAFRGWEIQFLQPMHLDDVETWYAFAKCFFKGEVFSDLKNIQWTIELDRIRFTNLDPKIAKFVNTIKAIGKFEKEALQSEWRQDKNWLYNEIMPLTKKESLQKLKSIWPPKK